MKTWTMPRVKIEGFSANEYVAGSCHNAFVANEAKIQALVTDPTHLDFDGSGGGGWGYVNNPPHGSQKMSTTTLDDWQRMQNLDGPYECYVNIGQRSETEVNGLIEEGVILPGGSFVTGYWSGYWAKVNVYWYIGSGSNRWHPSAIPEAQINFS